MDEHIFYLLEVCAFYALVEEISAFGGVLLRGMATFGTRQPMPWLWASVAGGALNWLRIRRARIHMGPQFRMWPRESSPFIYYMYIYNTYKLYYIYIYIYIYYIFALFCQHVYFSSLDFDTGSDLRNFRQSLIGVPSYTKVHLFSLQVLGALESSPSFLEWGMNSQVLDSVKMKCAMTVLSLSPGRRGWSFRERWLNIFYTFLFFCSDFFSFLISYLCLYLAFL